MHTKHIKPNHQTTTYTTCQHCYVNSRPSTNPPIQNQTGNNGQSSNRHPGETDSHTRQQLRKVNNPTTQHQDPGHLDEDTRHYHNNPQGITDTCQHTGHHNKNTIQMDTGYLGEAINLEEWHSQEDTHPAQQRQDTGHLHTMAYHGHPRVTSFTPETEHGR